MMKNILRTLLAVTLLSGSFAFCQNTDKPDFTGRWRMSKDKSNFAGFKTPDIITRNVEQHGTVMNVHTVQTLGEKTAIADITYNMDGTPSQNVISGRDAESRSFWDGTVLVIKTTMHTSRGNPELIEDRWSLSDDKQTLTIASHIETDKGGAEMTLVCDRQK